MGSRSVAPQRADAAGPTKRSPQAASRKPRRFVLPKLEEDRDRAERAIQAVLGEPMSDRADAAQHRPRRRARRHRSGAVEHTPVDLAVRGLDQLRSVGGPDASVRVMTAVHTAVRGNLRSGDRSIELGEGRLRVVLEADAPGATAAADRLRAQIAGWLEASVVPLGLRVAIVGPDAADAEGAAAS